MNVDEQAQIQLLALSLKELIQSSAVTALDQLFVFLAVRMRSLSQSPAHSARSVTSAVVCRTDARKTSEKVVFVRKKPDCSGSHGS